VNGRWNSATAANEAGGRKGVHRHYWCAAQQAAKLDHVADHAPGTGIILTAVVLLFITPMAISSAMMAEIVSAEVETRHGHHIDTYGTDAGPGFQFVERQCTQNGQPRSFPRLLKPG